MTRVWAAVLFLGLVASGCATATFTLTEKDDRLAGHYILAHEDGWPISHRRTAVRPEEYQTYINDKILAGIDGRACGLWQQRQPLRILLFVHGGLNGYATDFDRMRQLMLGTEDSGTPLFSGTQYYPIFVNWNSALGDSILDDLVFIRFGTRQPWWAGLPTASFVLAGRLSESVFNTPTAWWANTRNFEEMSPGPPEWTESLIMLPVRGFMTPILRAFGTSAWQIMKRRADLLVASRLDDNPARAPEGAARTLVNQLAARLGTGPSGGPEWNIATGNCGVRRGPVEITVVGHSMGALVLNRLLAAHPAFRVKHVVYLAPASSIEEIEGFVGPYLKSHDDAKFWLFTLSRRDEARERDPSGLLPRGTLLVWIDSFFEPVTTLGAMRMGRYKGYLEYYRRRTPDPPVTVYRMPDEGKNVPRAHGEFDDPPFLTRILCSVDTPAFRDPAFCDDQRFPVPTAIRGERLLE